MKSIIDSKTIDRLATLLRGVKNIVVTCHLSPDGDALGSTMGLCRMLRNMGKEAVVITPDQYPRSLQFLPETRDIVVYTKSELRARFYLSRAELVFCLDFNMLQRIDQLGHELQRAKVPLVLIDHHLGPERIFDVSISFPQASSTCELVYRTIAQLGLLRYVDRTVAELLYVGMMTDTGNFTYSCNDPEVFEIVAALMKHGVDRVGLYKLAMNTFSEASLRLQGYALSQKMQVFPEKHVAVIALSKAELAEYGYAKGDTEGLVNKPLAIPGVVWSVFLREDADKVKVSMRSEGDFAVNELCSQYFGGGGHLNAAGGDSHDPLDKALDVVYGIIDSIRFDDGPAQ